MKIQSKVCESKDWFDNEVLDVIKNELESVPRLHRKQWEFAVIFLMLKKMGFIDPEKKGLSMGGGKEILLYSIARRIKHLMVTDLYDSDTGWDCARTDDPGDFIKENKPFDVSDSKLSASRMDMRNLDFENESFDFCYSSCSFEHIGEEQDFIDHLNEAYRVLKDGGVYVFTTEFLFGEKTIPNKGNYLFAADHLASLIEATDFSIDGGVNAEITPSQMNFPLPPQAGNIMFNGKDNIMETLSNEHPHVHISRGEYSFTSVMLILRKDKNNMGGKVEFFGLDKSIEHSQKEMNRFNYMLNNFTISLNPYSFGGSSKILADHAEFMAKIEDEDSDNLVFHTDYLWMGNGERISEITINTKEPTPKNCTMEIRIHERETLHYGKVECIQSSVVIVGRGGFFFASAFKAKKNCCYAIAGRMVNGSCEFGKIEVKVSPDTSSTTSNQSS